MGFRKFLFAIALCTFAVPAFAQPANDNCGVADIPLVLGANAIDTTGATLDGPLDCDADIGADAWFTFSVPTTGALAVSTCNAAGFDSMIVVYDGTLGCPVGGAVTLACNDDDFATPCAANTSLATLNVTAGDSLLIQVGGWLGADGTHTLTLEYFEVNCGDGVDDDLDGFIDCADSDCAADPLCASANDSCTAPEIVGLGSTAFDSSAATLDGPTDCEASLGNDLWFEHTVATTGQLQIDTCTGTAFDTVLAVFDSALGCPVALSPSLACNDQGCGNQSLVSIPVVAGDVLLIQVSGWNAASGPGELNLEYVELDCGNGLDDDTDGLADCDDSDCSGDALCFVEPATAVMCTDDLAGTVTVTWTPSITSGASAIAQNISVNGVDVLIGEPITTSMFTTPYTVGVPETIEVCITTTFGAGSSVEACCTINVSPPTNDNCLDAIPAVVGDNPFSNVGTTLDGPIDCDGGMGTDVWFTYTTTTGNVTMGMCNAATFDTVLTVYDNALGCPLPGAPFLACDDDACTTIGLSSEVTIATAPGTVLLIQAGGFGGATGDATLTITEQETNCVDGLDDDMDGLVDCADPDCANDAACATTNDACALAEIALLGDTPIDNTAATLDGPLDCNANMTGDVWYQHTATVTGALTFSLCAGTTYDSVMALYDFSGGICPTAGAATLGCNDDGCGVAFGPSVATINVTAGDVILVQIGGWQGATGAGVLNIAQDCGDLGGATCAFDPVSGAVTVNWTDNANATLGYTILENGVSVGTAPAGSSSFVVAAPVGGINTYEVTWECSITALPGPSVTCAANVILPIPAGTTDLILAQESLSVGGTGTHDSAALQLALENNSRTVHTVAAADFDLSGLDFNSVETIWVLLGTFPNQYDMSVAEGDLLATLNAAGIGIYVEGPDRIGFNHEASLFSARDGHDDAVVNPPLNYTAAIDGDDSFTAMDAQVGGVADLASIWATPQVYTQDNAVGNDFTDPLILAAADAEVTLVEALWANNDDTATGEPAYFTTLYAEHTTGENSIVSSWEFAGFPVTEHDALAAEYLELLGRGGGTGGGFIRPECNGDGNLNIADAIFLLGILFPGMGGPNTPPCELACDANDDNSLNIADAIFTLGVLFPGAGGPPAVAPPNAMTGCGNDPTPGGVLTCGPVPACP